MAEPADLTADIAAHRAARDDYLAQAEAESDPEAKADLMRVSLNEHYQAEQTQYQLDYEVEMRAKISRIQQASGNSVGVDTVSASWSDQTTEGNLLLAVVSEAPGIITVTPPTGWILVEDQSDITYGVHLYRIPESASRSGAETFTYDSAPTAATLALIEYEGAKTLNKHVVRNQSSSADLATTASGTTSIPWELLFACFSQRLEHTFSAPTNSFVIGEQIKAGTELSSVWLERIVNEIGTYTAGVHTDPSGDSLSILATFEAVH